MAAVPPIIMESNVSMGWLLTLNARIFLFIVTSLLVFWKSDFEKVEILPMDGELE